MSEEFREFMPRCYPVDVFINRFKKQTNQTENWLMFCAAKLLFNNYKRRGMKKSSEKKALAAI